MTLHRMWKKKAKKIAYEMMGKLVSDRKVFQDVLTTTMTDESFDVTLPDSERAFDTVISEVKNELARIRMKL